MNNPRPALGRWVWISVAVIIVDQLTKTWAVRNLADGRVIDVFATIKFRLGFNTGMAFSRGTGLGPLIGVIALVVVGVLVSSLARHATPGMRVAIGLIVGGAIGNLADRLFRSPGLLRGAVVDFIQAVSWFPTFNVADAAITVGGALLLLTWRSARATEGVASTGDSADGEPDSDDESSDAANKSASESANKSANKSAAKPTTRPGHAAG